jgi:hypothetical protein
MKNKKGKKSRKITEKIKLTRGAWRGFGEDWLSEKFEC